MSEIPWWLRPFIKLAVNFVFQKVKQNQPSLCLNSFSRSLPTSMWNLIWCPAFGVCIFKVSACLHLFPILLMFQAHFLVPQHTKSCMMSETESVVFTYLSSMPITVLDFEEIAVEWMDKWRAGIWKESWDKSDRTPPAWSPLTSLKSQ